MSVLKTLQRMGKRALPCEKNLHYVYMILHHGIPKTASVNYPRQGRSWS